MGYDYALVHLRFTIPPAVILTCIYRPFLTRLSLYKIVFLIAIAVVSTTPWDSYLIRQRIWTYPPRVIIGPTLFSIPAEEVFFFIVQTYMTSLLYLITSVPTFHPAYLIGSNSAPTSQSPPAPALGLPQSASSADLELPGWRRATTLARIRRIRTFGQILIGCLIGVGGWMVWDGGKATYLGLILVWACPFIFMLWTLAHQLLVNLPISNTIMPIAIPTIYLWVVDTLALRRGTWVIESRTKLGWHLWKGLDIEEAVFFLISNTLVVLGLVAFDNALAVLYTFPYRFPRIPTWPSPILLVRALILDPAFYDSCRIRGSAQALDRLRAKSRSFYLASGAFQGRLRMDLMLLYAFCRIADDLIDEAPSLEVAESNLAKLRRFLDMNMAATLLPDSDVKIRDYVCANFATDVREGLLQLPITQLSYGPLFDMLRGFQTDLRFHDQDYTGAKSRSWPIATSADLEKYALRVAGTVAESCIELILFHTPAQYTDFQRQQILAAGRQMGVALQYVNIARDITTDARIGRVYLPSEWLKEHGLTSDDVLAVPSNPEIDILKGRLLREANIIYAKARPAIEDLPVEARAPMRVAVESYMEIGRVLSDKTYHLKAGRATVPKLRRLRVAWQALARG